MVRIQELASVLVDRYGLGKDDAEQFVSQMFQLVTDELNASQKSVKIKGLGTFKVTSVNSRESVDVNTGDRIVISGRNKISFTPDVVMRDRVNRPFAQFETVVVNDGVDFSEIDKMSDAELLGQVPGEDIPASESGEETVPGDGNVSLNDGENETVSESAAVGSGVVQEAPAVVPSGESKLPEEKPEVACASESVANTTDDVETMDSGEPEPKGKRILFWGMLGLLVVILVACGFGIYYMYGLVQQRNAKIELLERKMKQVAPVRKNIVKPSADGDSACNNPGDAEQKVMAVETEKADSSAAKVLHEKPDNGVPDIDYSSDPRLRTGAYIIIGVEKTVEVRKGQTLESISKAYLGNGMECYVEAVNSCKEVSAGDKLKIPKLKLKKRNK